MRWQDGEVRPMAVEGLGERYRRYRLSDPAAEEAMARSLRQYGQSSPVVVCERDGRPELLDGFKRRAAALVVPLRTLSVRVVEADEATAKAAIYGLNRPGSQPSELEEAWIVHALVREDGLSASAGGRAVGTSQELGQSPAGVVGTTVRRGPRRAAAGLVGTESGPAVGAVARGQPVGSVDDGAA